MAMFRRKKDDAASQVEGDEKVDLSEDTDETATESADVTSEELTPEERRRRSRLLDAG